MNATTSGTWQPSVPVWWISWRDLVALELHPSFGFGVSIGTRCHLAIRFGPFQITLGRRHWLRTQELQTFTINWIDKTKRKEDD